MGARRVGDPPLFYDTHVFVCCNTRPEGHPRGSCARKGSERLRDYMKARAKELGSPMTVTVVDEGGRLVLCARGDGTGFFTPETSKAKAVAAAAFKRSNRLSRVQTTISGDWATLARVIVIKAVETKGAVPPGM